MSSEISCFLRKQKKTGKILIDILRAGLSSPNESSCEPGTKLFSSLSSSKCQVKLAVFCANKKKTGKILIDILRDG